MRVSIGSMIAFANYSTARATLSELSVDLELLGHLGEHIDPALHPCLKLRLHLLAVHALEALQLLLECLGILSLHLLNEGLLLVVAALEGSGVAGDGIDLVALDLEDLHAEDEGRTPRDLGRAAALAIGQVAGDVHLPLVSLHHQLHGLGPSLDHL